MSGSKTNRAKRLVVAPSFDRSVDVEHPNRDPRVAITNAVAASAAPGGAGVR